MHANIATVINVLLAVYNKTCENWAMLSLHGQLALDIWPRCGPKFLKLTRLQLINFEHPWSPSFPNIQCLMSLTQ